jgi:hypothetical protein
VMKTAVGDRDFWVDGTGDFIQYED